MTATRRVALLVLGGFMAMAVVLHVAAGHTFPVPWVDEVDFMAPAQALARHGSLAVPNLNAPGGMYWVSDAYYFLLAPVLRFWPATVDVGRTVSLLAILVAAAGFWVAARRAHVRPVFASALVGFWLIAPKVVIAGNIARHEAVVLACVAWALACAVKGQRLGAVTLAVLAAVVHPAGAPFAAAIVVGALALPRLRTARWEWVAAGVLAAFVGFEVIHFAANWSIASEQLRFQLHRKAGRHVPLHDAGFLLGFLGAVGLSVHAKQTPLRRAGLFVATGMAGSVVSVYGHEMWYGVYGLPTGALLVGLGALIGLPHLRLSLRPQILSSVVMVLSAGAVFVLQPFSAGFYGMQINGPTSEWTQFVASVHTELRAIDRASVAPTTVSVDSTNGLPWPLEYQRVGRVTVRKDTAVTKTAGPVVATVTSPHGVYEATVSLVGAD